MIAVIPRELLDRTLIYIRYMRCVNVDAVFITVPLRNGW
jgi:hypothetical protein